MTDFKLTPKIAPKRLLAFFQRRKIFAILALAAIEHDTVPLTEWHPSPMSRQYIIGRAPTLQKASAIAMPFRARYQFFELWDTFPE